MYRCGGSIGVCLLLRRGFRCVYQAEDLDIYVFGSLLLGIPGAVSV